MIFWSLNLPTQTKNYVPKYIALRELILNPEKYGITLPNIPYDSVVQKIIIPGQVEILALSEYLEIKPELLYKLNAGYTKWASAPKDESIFLFLKKNIFYFLVKKILLIKLMTSIGYHIQSTKVIIFGICNKI